MRVKRKRLEHLERIANTRLVWLSRSGPLLDITLEHLYLITKFGGTHDGTIYSEDDIPGWFNGPTMLKVDINDQT